MVLNQDAFVPQGTFDNATSIFVSNNKVKYYLYTSEQRMLWGNILQCAGPLAHNKELSSQNVNSAEAEKFLKVPIYLMSVCLMPIYTYPIIKVGSTRTLH